MIADLVCLLNSRFNQSRFANGINTSLTLIVKIESTYPIDVYLTIDPVFEIVSIMTYPNNLFVMLETVLIVRVLLLILTTHVLSLLLITILLLYLQISSEK